MTEQGAVVFAEYRRDGAEADHRPCGDAGGLCAALARPSRLMAAIADKAKGEKLTIVPICGSCGRVAGAASGGGGVGLGAYP